MEDRLYKILSYLSIRNTEVRQEILRILLALPLEILSIKEITQRLKSNGVPTSHSSIIETLLMFQMRGLIRLLDTDKSKKRKRGRPESNFIFNHDLISEVI
jgi:Fe2+ or Zn2+ uptake regulation protein